MLEQFRRGLLTRNERQETIESAGPLVFGSRLRSGRFPGAYRAILYEKGAWVLHMLRGKLGDEAFFGLLRSLSDDFDQKELTVDGFRAAAAQRLPGGAGDPELRDFFDQWVYNTGIPGFRAQWSQEGDALTGILRQADVADHAGYEVTLRAFLQSGETMDFVVVTEGSETEFAVRAAGKVQRVAVDPERKLLRAGR